MALEPSVAIIRPRGYKDKPGSLGRLYVDGQFISDVLEPRHGKCAPEGTHRIVLEWSPKFGRKLWEMKDIPGRSEIKLHTGNFLKDTDGCPLPGTRVPDGRYELVGGSSYPALERFHAAMGDATSAWITIREEERHAQTAR